MFLDWGVHFLLGEVVDSAELGSRAYSGRLRPTQFLIIPFPNSVSQLYRGANFLVSQPNAFAALLQWWLS